MEEERSQTPETNQYSSTPVSDLKNMLRDGGIEFLWRALCPDLLKPVEQ